MSETNKSGELTLEERDRFLDLPIVARLATVSPDGRQPHVVPVWFLWDGSSLWISSYRSTRKVRDLLANPYCSVVIDESESALTYKAVLFEGEVEVIHEPSEVVKEMFQQIYIRYLGPKGILAPDPQEWIHDPENFLIKLVPQKIKTWFSRTADEEK